MCKMHHCTEWSYFFASDYERELFLLEWMSLTCIFLLWWSMIFALCTGTRKTRITAPQGTAKYLSRLKATDEQCIIRLVITVPFSSKVAWGIILALRSCSKSHSVCVWKDLNMFLYKSLTKICFPVFILQGNSCTISKTCNNLHHCSEVWGRKDFFNVLLCIYLIKIQY